MESISKSIVNNFVPPLKALNETNDNTHWILIGAVILVGALVGALATSIYVDIVDIKKTKQLISANTNEK